MTGMPNTIIGAIAWLIAYFLPTKTVDRAVGVLDKAVKAVVAAELAQTAVAEAHFKKAAELTAAAANATKLAGAATAEASRAARVRSNIEAITA